MVDLDALTRLHEAATPGPWVARRDNPRKYAPLGIWGEGRRLIAMYGDDGREANLIVAARNALPDLLRELREARGIIERFRVGDLEFDLMQTEEGDCWTDSLVMANKWLRAALSRETTGGGE